jgi:hypothetical protein
MYHGAPTFAETCLFLEGAGFRFFAMVGTVTSRLQKLPVQGDFLFIRNSYR